MNSSSKAKTYFEIYQRRRSELLALAREQLDIIRQLGIKDANSDGVQLANFLVSLIERIENEQLRVLVVGRFNAGKSTFINALFGKAELPAAPVPATGVLCQIRYAEEAKKRAILYPKPGMGKDGGDEPFEVKIQSLHEELSKYVKIDHLGDSTATSRYKLLELYWPLELCRQGVELIDSVGLDDPDSRDAITLDFAQSADVILYLMKSQDAYSAKDKQVLTLLKSLGHEAIMFIITNYDNVREAAASGETSEEHFKRIQYHNLTPWTELKDRGIQYVDSKAALQGRIRGDRELINASGIEPVEEAMTAFLTEEKGRAKLMASLRPLRSINLDTSRQIPSQIQLWQASASILEKRYREAEGPLRLLEITRKAMVSAVEADIKDVARDSRDLADVFFMELPDKIRFWAKEYEVKCSVGFPPRKATIQPVVEEVLDHLKGRMAEETAKWNQTVLLPKVQRSVTAIEDKLEDKAREFVQSVEQIRVQIAVGDEIDKADIATQKEPTFLARLIGLGYTLATGDVVTGGVGMVVGPKAMINTIVLQVVAGVVLAIFGLLNPVAIVIAAIAAILGGNFLNVLQLRKAIREKVAESLATKIIESRGEMAKAVQDSILKQLEKLRDALDAGLAKEVDNLRGGVETVLEEKKAGESNSESQIIKIRGLDVSNRAVEQKLDSLFEEAEAVRA